MMDEWGAVIVHWEIGNLPPKKKGTFWCPFFPS